MLTHADRALLERILHRIEALERAHCHRGGSVGGSEHTPGRVYDRFAEEVNEKFNADILRRRNP